MISWFKSLFRTYHPVVGDYVTFKSRFGGHTLSGTVTCVYGQTKDSLVEITTSTHAKHYTYAKDVNPAKS